MIPSFLPLDFCTSGWLARGMQLHQGRRALTGGLLAAVLLLAGCAQAPTAPTPPAEAKPAVKSEPPPAVTPPAPVVVAPPAPVAPPPAKPATPSAAEIATAPSTTPPGTTRYQCVRGGGDAKPIEFPESSGRICARFPAMGPCQYQRDACRRDGGRVIRFDGIEITTDVEREYDKQVQRFRLNAG